MADWPWYRLKEESEAQTNGNCVTIKPPAKTSAERKRAYRLRQKIKAQQNSDSVLVKKKPKTSSERQREFRLRQKMEAQQNSDSAIVKNKLKTSTESCSLENCSLDKQQNSNFIEKQLSSAQQNIDEICQVSSQPHNIRELSDRKVANFPPVEIIQPEYFYKDDDEDYYNDEGVAWIGNATDQNDVHPDVAHQGSNNHQTEPFKAYRSHKAPHKQFQNMFVKNSFGHACNVCDRLWFLQDLKADTVGDESLLRKNTKYNNVAKICKTCKTSIKKSNIPSMAIYNGFKYPDIPMDLPAETAVYDDTRIETFQRLENSGKIDKKACVTKCVIKSCLRSYRDSSERRQVRLFHFPKNESIRRIWIEKCDLNVNTNVDNIVVCDYHFEKRCFGKKFLKRGAIPSLRLNADDNYKGNSIDFDEQIPTVKNCALPARTCGLIEVTRDNTNSYTLNCIHCAEKFSIMHWTTFLVHMKEKHHPLEQNINTVDLQNENTFVDKENGFLIIKTNDKQDKRSLQQKREISKDTTPADGVVVIKSELDFNYYEVREINAQQEYNNASESDIKVLGVTEQVRLNESIDVEFDDTNIKVEEFLDL